MTKTNKYVMSLFLIFIHIQVFANSLYKDNWSKLSENQYQQNRIACQTKIEDLRWSQNTWPKDNKKAKPTRPEIISDEYIANKVKKSIQMEVALFELSGISINQKMLQADLDRMIKNTKQPEKLKSLFEALNNNPNTIAECISRPYLVTSEMRDYFIKTEKSQAKQSFDEWWLSTKTNLKKRSINRLIAPLTLSKIISVKGSSNNIEANTWKQIATTPLPNEPEARARHVAYWTGTEMLIWGGDTNYSNFFNTGGKYNPTTDSWETTSTLSAPERRTSQIIDWTGTEMIVWGGYSSIDGNITYYNSGSKYNPFTNTWTEMSTINAATGRRRASSIWTGDNIIIWGGQNGNSSNIVDLNTGFKYNPISDSWTEINTINAPTARNSHTSLWTGSEMIIWKGKASGADWLDTGGIYNPETNTWRSMAIFGIDHWRNYGYSVTWTGTEMVIWGGSIFQTSFNSGGRYNPETNTWLQTTMIDSPGHTTGHKAIWTGKEMILWGGGSYGLEDFLSSSNTGYIYSPTTDSWQQISNVNRPFARSFHSAIWTGTEMIIWGGSSSNYNDVTYFSDIGIYVLNTDDIFKNSFEDPYILADAFDLNDTGITWAGDSPSGNNTSCTSNIVAPQDCDEGRDISNNDDSDGHAGFSFTKLDADGIALAIDAAQWSCIKDNVTGIIWENKTTFGLHHNNDLFSWYNTNSDTNGENEGVNNSGRNLCFGYDANDPSTFCNSEAYVNRVNSQGLCGADDWILPNVNELSSIVNYAVFNPSIDANFFPNTINFQYWTANTRVRVFDGALFSAHAWIINFATGHDLIIDKSSSSHIRLIRREQ